MTITRTCDFDDGCGASETLTPDHDGRMREDYDDGRMVVDMPVEVMGDILWCNYEPEEHPKGQYLCREHAEQIRRERGIVRFA